MNELIILFFSLRFIQEIKISEINEDADDFFIEFLLALSVFNLGNYIIEDKGLQGKALHCKTDEYQKKVEAFILKYSKNFPQLNMLGKIIRDLEPGEYFYILPNSFNDYQDQIPYINCLILLNEGKEFNEVEFNTLNAKHLKLIEKIEGNYKIVIPPHKIGEPNKSKRLCRFCKNTRKNLSFNKKAHAISEALGNKKIILYDECDSCNQEFGDYLEKSLINFLGFYRVWFDIKGKRGTPEIQIKNGNLKHENGKMTISLKVNDLKSNQPPNILKLEFIEPYIPVNVYKTLSKYALSVIDSDNLKSFEKTIEWINDRKNKNIIKLPKVVMFFKPVLNYEPVKIILFIRKNENKEYPFLFAEFNLEHIVLVYIIPFSNQDYKGFNNDKEFTNFENLLKNHYKQAIFEFKDFSDIAEVKNIKEIVLKK
jgi:hypothetical protein